MMIEAMLVHLSDMHFGPMFFAPPAATKIGSIPVPAFHRMAAPLCQGLAFHDVDALESIENSVRRLKLELNPTWSGLVTSGDLTTTGEASEFVMALSFTRERIRRSWMDTVGLGGLLEEAMCVPGNHDHLQGHRASLLARPSPANVPRDTYFGQPQGSVWWRHRHIQTDAISIQIGGLDSCGACTPQYGARGVIDPQALVELGHEFLRVSALPGLPARRVRILTIHHSPAFAGGFNGWLHALDPTSRGAYDSFCRTHQIHFTLTGHIHKPDVPRPGPHSGVIELRCGSSAQRSLLPNIQDNYFLAHLMEPTSTGVEWTTRVFQRGPRGAFLEAKSKRYRTVI